MPSVGTTAWTIRVKNGTKVAIEDAAVHDGMTAAQLINLFGECLADGAMWVENGRLTFEVEPTFEPQHDEGTETYHDLHLDKLVKAMRDKGYPDRVIRDRIDGMVEQVIDGFKYNARRDSGEWGC